MNIVEELETISSLLHDRNLGLIEQLARATLELAKKVESASVTTTDIDPSDIMIPVSKSDLDRMLEICSSEIPILARAELVRMIVSILSTVDS